MFEIHEETTWWSPVKHTVIDARDIAMLGVVKGTDCYFLHVVLSGVTDKREFNYPNLEELNSAIGTLGLVWADEVVGDA